MGFFEMMFRFFIMMLVMRVIVGGIMLIIHSIQSAIAKRRAKKLGHDYNAEKAKAARGTSKQSKGYQPNDQDVGQASNNRYADESQNYQGQETAQQAYARQQSEMRAKQQAAAQAQMAQAAAHQMAQAQAKAEAANQANQQRANSAVEVEVVEVEEK